MRPGSAGWGGVGGRAELVGDLAERIGQGMDLAAFRLAPGPVVGSARCTTAGSSMLNRAESRCTTWAIAALSAREAGITTSVARPGGPGQSGIR